MHLQFAHCLISFLMKESAPSFLQKPGLEKYSAVPVFHGLGMSIVRDLSASIHTMNPMKNLDSSYAGKQVCCGIPAIRLNKQDH